MEQRNDELYHYGVLGMKWGVHKAVKRLNRAQSQEEGQKAVASLMKHKTKATAKLTKLQKKQPKLEKRVQKAAEKTDRKAAIYESMAAKNKYKSARRFQPTEFKDHYAMKAAKYEAKAASLRSYSQKVKSELMKNQRMQESYKKGISEIDSALSGAGKKYVKNMK